MIVGVLTLRFRLPSRTLKEKRAIVKSVVERARSRFNAAVAEVDDHDTHGATTIAVACIANDGHQVQSQLDTIAEAITDWRLDAELLSVETELFEA